MSTDKQSHIARIIPGKQHDFGPAAAHGTRVVVGGTDLRGVTKVVLTAEANDVWRA
jgi:hypothetical protein